jgi:hypothetical protein
MQDINLVANSVTCRAIQEYVVYLFQFIMLDTLVQDYVCQVTGLSKTRAGK